MKKCPFQKDISLRSRKGKSNKSWQFSHFDLYRSLQKELLDGAYTPLAWVSTPSPPGLGVEIPPTHI